MLKENALRKSLVKPLADPLAGNHESLLRKEYPVSAITGGRKLYLPLSMLADPQLRTVTSQHEFNMLRMRHDFEFWAATCARIKDKMSGQDIPFILNRPQRELLEHLETQRYARKPLRLIILKARQWGCSTLIQLYLAWLQIMVCPGHHAIICGQVKDTASTIRGMYSKLLASYPPQYLPDGLSSISLRPFEKSANTVFVDGIGSRLTIGSSENQSAARCNDYSFAHLSEVAFWRDTPEATPEGFVRAVCGSINSVADTMIVMESTANGVGNFFHKEWLRSVDGKSDKEAVFIPWYKIEIYSTPLTDTQAQQLASTLDTYEKGLWNLGLTLEQIAWYRAKRREYPSAEAMMAEYPTDAVEAFTHSGHNVFSMSKLNILRETCIPPVCRGDVSGKALTGPAALEGVHFTEDTAGEMEVWKHPDAGTDYVLGVDIGGRSESSDWSVISVISKRNLEVVAQLRTHTDHDILAWKSAQIATYYNKALLVVESNTLETENYGGDAGSSVLNQIYCHYNNIYYRTDLLSGVTRVGFHTNRSTKLELINNLIALVRERGYIERSHDAIDELSVYRRNGASYGAIDGNHDDIVMSRALALFAARDPLA